jgi:hypothetical protein
MANMKANMKRYKIGYGALRPLLSLLGLGPLFSYVESDGVDLHVVMGWGFRARFPISSIRSVVAYEGTTMNVGVHGLAGRYLVNGKGSGIVTLEIEPTARALLLGIPVKLRTLSVSLDSPEQFIADFSVHG